MCKHQFLQTGNTIRLRRSCKYGLHNTEDPYFKDCFYWGELKTILMAELVKIDPEITNEQMEELPSIANLGIIIITHSSTKTFYFEILVLCFILITRRPHFCL